MSIEVELKCNDCRSILTYTIKYDHSWVTLDVEPCAVCGKEIRQEGYDEGYRQAEDEAPYIE
ncbi:MAG: hypothetical protein US20_C0026G0025 [Candidatus Pacebacteria bacterium GW2011_GWF1_36_5]|nr:MAG: hypothetical protein US20_C0026G0025 [Candidatus Pacebacteria bacterium GW2011_GWF1_36_5]